MHSLRTKITLITILAILISTLLVGTISIASAKAEAERRSEELMNLLCEAKCDEINNYFYGIEQSVGTVSRYVYESLDIVELADADVIGATGAGKSLDARPRSKEQQAKLDAYLAQHLLAVSEIFGMTARDNANILDYYYRLNPELSNEVHGFWYARTDSINFEQYRLTDIDSYKEDDHARVGWYYTPLERGRPSWLDPYHNENMGEMVVSYAAPVYRAGTFIGLVGIDVSYSTLVERISSLEVLDTGYAFLTDGKGKVVYHPLLESGVMLSEVSAELEIAAQEVDTDELITYNVDGMRKKAAWGMLSNGLKLIVAAPDAEINAGWRNMSWLIVFAALFILVVFAVITMTVMRRITNPLENLARASEELSAGHYDVALTYSGDDEVGVLTKAFVQMATHLQVFIQDLNSKAYKDALTGVRNKGALDIYSFKLNESIRQGTPDEQPEFSIAMFDCNNLKGINDTYGHEKGDHYLKTACTLICRVFAHSPVFRVGGDEFVVVLQNDDLRNLAELERRFDDSVGRINASARNEWERVNIARGVAAFDAATDEDLDSVLRRADAAMYECKRRMKAG